MSIQVLTPDEENHLLQSTNRMEEFTLLGEIKVCKVVSVYDGDTIKVCFYHNNIINKWSVRLLGLDTPELRPSRLLSNRQDEIRKAKESRDYLRSILLPSKNDTTQKLFYLKCFDFDKYGRLLGEIFEYQPVIFKNNNSDYQTGGTLSNTNLHPSSINTLMITNGYAKYYDGGKKK
tara:strand:+ start:824 stop:1351 length:528 start_codon:yes stop_codon:yes gene_type:complete